MALCKIIKTFKGSQDGRHSETFEAGTEVELSEYLMACAPKGHVALVEPPADEPPADAGGKRKNKGNAPENK